jgi:hypothetical protein
MGTIKRSRLTVYPYGDGLATDAAACGDTRTVCSVSAAGTASMARIARTSRKLERGEPDAREIAIAPPLPGPKGTETRKYTIPISAGKDYFRPRCRLSGKY